MTEYNVKNRNNYEPRNCFKTTKHGDHLHEAKTYPIPGYPPVFSRYWCNGNQPRPEPREWAETTSLPLGYCGTSAAHAPHDFERGDHLIKCLGLKDENGDAVNGLGEQLPTPEPVESNPAPGILDGRAAYGDRVTNMREQAAMINAYLGTPPRAIEPHDVPILFVLIKAHRLGKMPDYADNYDDIDGYMRIAREVIGDDMIQAATASEYQNIKANGQKERVVEIRVPAPHYEDLIDPEVAKLVQQQYAGPRHPYDDRAGENID